MLKASVMSAASWILVVKSSNHANEFSATEQQKEKRHMSSVSRQISIK